MGVIRPEKVCAPEISLWSSEENVSNVVRWAGQPELIIHLRHRHWSGGAKGSSPGCSAGRGLCGTGLHE